VQTNNSEFNDKVSRSKGEEKTKHMQTNHRNKEINSLIIIIIIIVGKVKLSL
jgi:hypothetical protein